MFYECSSLKELNINNFNTINVTDMCGIFSGCSSLKELNLNNLNTNNVTRMKGMFFNCSIELQEKIKKRYKNIKEEAFEKFDEFILILDVEMLIILNNLFKYQI